ncbi:Butyrate kinase 2 [Candidatus Venteria ishoeyi]|uniref:Probable butyrate kinase n=2 Tax=Candidatus Venteria ishoeyi TaxID=1899563 RepID=A0A1H6F8D7_9GAMM|nr:Butyrate kinase 2 [Candidatus Venteria ishoeyi]
MDIILHELKNAGIYLNSILAVMGRGGLVKPVQSGVIEVNDALIHDLINSPLGEHASNLGGLIAHDIALKLKNGRAFIVDPVVVDEFEPIARISGHPLFERKSIFHPLNQKAVSRLHASSINKNYEDLNLIVAHMGGGITIGAHKKGKVIDVNNGLDAEGPITPERSGTVPCGDLAKLCFSGKYTHDEIKQILKGKGGYVAYFGTNDGYAVEQMAASGDEKAILIQNALAYQVAKYIGAMSTVLKGNVDGILLTGGMAYGKTIVDAITERVKHISPVFVYPGEDEMRALAMNGLRVLNGETDVIEYT